MWHPRYLETSVPLGSTIEKTLFSQTEWTRAELALVYERLKAREKLQNYYHLSESQLRYLKNFVQKEAQRGALREEIISELTKAGWQEELLRHFVHAYAS